MKLSKDTLIGVVGAGTMGRGIAQVAAAAGYSVLLYDKDERALEISRSSLQATLAKLEERGKLTAAQAQALFDRIDFHPAPAGFARVGLTVEAIVEDLAVKQDLLTTLESIVPSESVLATNTSSLSVTALASACRLPSRVLGMHFFNPAPLMPLVEIVPGFLTDPQVVEAARQISSAWGKVPVIAKDTPGFIVNRVARPFYGEALRLLEEGVADVATIDWSMREIGGFRMGPFELMDLIGNDVNAAVTETVWRALFFDPRFRPSLLQKNMVAAGLLGRKSERGFYDYRADAVTPEPRRDMGLGHRIVDRIVAMLVNEAYDLLLHNVATAADIDLAMTKGVNYPMGPIAWGKKMGLGRVVEILAGLQDEYGEDRYRPNVHLRREASRLAVRGDGS